MKVGLSTTHSFYFLIEGEITSNLFPFSLTDLRISDFKIFDNTASKLSNRLRYTTAIVDVPDNYTFNDIKHNYPEHFI